MSIRIRKNIDVPLRTSVIKITKRHFDIIEKYVKENDKKTSGSYHFLLWQYIKGHKKKLCFDTIFDIEFYIFSEMNLVTPDEAKQALNLLYSKSKDDFEIGHLAYEHYSNQALKMLDEYSKILVEHREKLLKVIINARKTTNTVRV